MPSTWKRKSRNRVNFNLQLQSTTEMLGEEIDRLDPQPAASNVLDLVMAVKLDRIHLSDEDFRGVQEFRRASNYISAGKFSPKSFHPGIF